jgi:hypothetical protein
MDFFISVFASLVDFGMALLVAAPLDFSQRHPFDSELSQGVLDILQSKGFNDGFYLLHRNLIALVHEDRDDGELAK